MRASVVGGVVPGKSQWGVLWSCAWVKTLSQVVVGSGGGKRSALWVGVVCGREDDLLARPLSAVKSRELEREVSR